MMKSIIVIPALNPSEKLIAYTDELIRCGAEHIVIVNDGSSKEHEPIFEQLERRSECRILVHKTNMGKGRALKDAFSYILGQKAWTGKSVITADSDGQHLACDLLRLDERMGEEPALKASCLYLGCRNFDREQIPWRSRFGNQVTSVLFRLLYRTSITDTQTGLRGIPYELLEPFSQLKGERFEYEMNMLTDAALQGIPIETIEIETVYLDNNTESHFRPIMDSFQIYRILLGNFLKYCFSSLLSALLDLLLFMAAERLLPSGPYQILTATVIARLFSSLFNYWYNKTRVFQDTGGAGTSIYKYYGLCIAVMLVSAGSVTLLSPLPVPNALLKVLVDTILYFFNYYIQKYYIFKRKPLQKADQASGL